MTVPNEFKTDCRQFRTDRPCAPHKRDGRACADCDEYDPVRQRVLVIKLAALGDVLRTTSFLPAIHASFGPCRVTWVTSPQGRELFEGNHLVDEVLSSGDAVTAARLAVEEFDAVLCPDADPAAAALAGVARGKEHRGFKLNEGGEVVPLGEAAEHWFKMGLDDQRKRDNAETYQKLVAELLGLDPGEVGEPILEPSESDRQAVAGFREALGFDGPLVGLNTGAGGRWVYKSWTLEHQTSFLTLMAELGVGVLLLGGPPERQRHAELLSGAQGLPVFDGGNDNACRRFASLVDLCEAVVTGDTFALHVATARKKPVIALFGPTSAAEIELYGRGEKIQPDGLDCLCCYLPRCDVSPHCQALIEPQTVAQAVQHCL